MLTIGEKNSIAPANRTKSTGSDAQFSAIIVTITAITIEMDYKPWYDVIDSEIARRATPKTCDKIWKVLSWRSREILNLGTY